MARPPGSTAARKSAFTPGCPGGNGGNAGTRTTSYGKGNAWPSRSSPFSQSMRTERSRCTSIVGPGKLPSYVHAWAGGTSAWNRTGASSARMRMGLPSGRRHARMMVGCGSRSRNFFSPRPESMPGNGTGRGGHHGNPAGCLALGWVDFWAEGACSRAGSRGGSSNASGSWAVSRSTGARLTPGAAGSGGALPVWARSAYSTEPGSGRFWDVGVGVAMMSPRLARSAVACGPPRPTAASTALARISICKYGPFGGHDSVKDLVQAHCFPANTTGPIPSRTKKTPRTCTGMPLLGIAELLTLTARGNGGGGGAAEGTGGQETRGAASESTPMATATVQNTGGEDLGTVEFSPAEDDDQAMVVSAGGHSGPDEDTQSTGDAGSRLACGVIEWAMRCHRSPAGSSPRGAVRI